MTQPPSGFAFLGEPRAEECLDALGGHAGVVHEDPVLGLGQVFVALLRGLRDVFQEG